MTHEDPNQYSVKEILTTFVVPALNDLREQQALQKSDTEKRFAKLEAYKNKSLGAIILIIAFIVPLAVPIISAAMR